MSVITRFFAGNSGRDALRPLYLAVVAEGRQPAWYRDCRVPDTIDGRFDVIAALFAILLLRLEAEPASRPLNRQMVLLTETFIDDMDGSLRQVGIGDLMVGKQVGNMMSALGGRLTAFRAAFGERGALESVVRRNLFREAPPSGRAVEAAAERLRDFRRRVGSTPLDALLGGEVMES